MEEIVYSDNLVRVVVPEKTVRRFKIIEVSPEKFEKFTDGCYYKGKGYTAIYIKSKKEQGNDIIRCVSVTVDTRLDPKNFGFKELQTDPGVLNISVCFDSRATVVDCLLSIDLGNTRTSVLLVDQVNARITSDGGIAFYELPLHWAAAEASENEKMVGTFESVISLNHSHEDMRNGLSLSFMRLGHHATRNNRESDLQKHTADGVFSISSPKRYFFDEAPSFRTWLASSSPSGSPVAVCQELSGPLADSLLKKYPTVVKCNELPPSAMLSGMLVELYEQACRYVASNTFAKVSKNSCIRRISHIHVTYPSSFSKHERALYQRKLQQGIDAYIELHRPSVYSANPLDVQVLSCIDEATAVLAFYVHCEIRKVGFAAVWARTVGRPRTTTDTERYLVRIGVIDIGGGTTDLSIADVSPQLGQSQPTAAKIQVYCQDGINEAGDNFLGKFIRDVVFTKGVDALAAEYRVDIGLDNYENFRKIYNDQIGVNPSLTHEFWFMLAIALASHLDGVYQRGFCPEDRVFTFPKNVENLEFIVPEEVTGPWDRIFKAYVSSNRELPSLKAKTKLSLKIHENDVRCYVQTVESVFENAAQTFGRLIAAYDCDQVLFAGKTAEFYAVRSVFKNHIPVSTVKQMDNYYAGEGSPLSHAGVVPDAKVSTAMGGAFCALEQIQAQNNSVHLSFEKPQVLYANGYQWGVLSDPKLPPVINPFNQIKVDDQGILTVELGRIPLFLVRKRIGSVGMATLCYELSSKVAGLINWAIVRLRVIPLGGVADEDGARLEIVSVGKGKCMDGSDVTTENLSLRVCCFTGGKFWLDTGRIE